MPDDPTEPAPPRADDRSLRRSSPPGEGSVFDPFAGASATDDATEDAGADALGVPLPGRFSAEKPAMVIGRYKLVKELGKGGFGIVWQAEQIEPFRREVALKIIKPGMDSAEIIARFEAERQALALMDHPNISSVLDAGTTESGRPYFVMEMVRGVPITTYCDARRLTIPARLELFIPVCHAVQHAHQKAILHRDLKPSNILVTEVDGKPVPKVIDFGIAKALGSSPEAAPRASTPQTRAGSVIGTPQYMSPEQAGSVPDTDTRSDIYTLGVILYELLTGNTPLSREALRKGTFHEVLRLIRETDPLRPSSRAMPVTDAVRQTCAARRMEPEKLNRALRGDLDWITLKALEKERERRYGSAAGLAHDLERHLSHKPVDAGPPSAVYRFRKFVRRNQLAFGAAAVIVVLLVAGVAVSTWQWWEASRQRAEAIRQRNEARIQRAEATRERGEAVRQKDLAAQSYLQSLEILQRLVVSDPDNPAWQRQLGENLRKVAAILEAQGDPDAAGKFYQQSVEIEQRLNLTAAPTAFRFTKIYDITGYREWARKGDLWEEKLPTGEVKTYQVLRQDRVEGRIGSVVMEGKNKNLEIFVSNKDVPDPQIYSRTDQKKWQLLGKMENVR